MNAKLKPCPTCETLIAKTASKCPHCGASQAGPMERFSLLLMVALLLVLIAGLAGWLW